MNKYKLFILVGLLFFLGDYIFADSQKGQVGIRLMEKDKVLRWEQVWSELEVDADFQYSLGYAYQQGKGVVQDLEKAVKHYQLAAKQGHAKAQNNLGNCYRHGEGVEKDLEEAANWYLLAAAQGDSNFQLWLGNIYFYGIGVTVDFEEAIRWYLLSAEKDNVDAGYMLGHCYYYGSGVEKDLEMAMKWYRLSRKQGNMYALISIIHIRIFQALTTFPKTAGIIFAGLLGAVVMRAYPDHVSNGLNQLGSARNKAIRSFIGEVIRRGMFLESERIQTILIALVNYIGANDLISEMTTGVTKDVLIGKGIPDVLSDLILGY